MGYWKSWVFSTLPELPGPWVLELGYGPGHLQLALKSEVNQVFGVDLSPQMGRIAYQRLAKANSSPNLVRASAEFLPFAMDIFDQIVATFPSEYIAKSRTLTETRRTLNQAGRIVVLPVAWIRGKYIWDRAAAWLFRLTGQAPNWNKHFSDPFRLAGFKVEEKLIRLPGSEVMLVIGYMSRGT